MLIKNIKELVQVETKLRNRICGKEMSEISTIKNAFLFIKNGKIHAFGKMKDIGVILQANNNLKVIDAKDKMVFPSFCDSHTHLVYAGS